MIETVSPNSKSISGSPMDRRVAPGRWTRLRRWVPTGVGLLAVGAGAAAYDAVPSSGTLAVAASEVTIGTAQQEPFQDYLPVRATVAPLRSVYVGAGEGGEVSKVLALDGSVVTAGTILATLSNPQLELDVTSREAAIAGQLGEVSAQRLALQQNLLTQENTIAEARYDLLKAKRELKVRRDLQQQGFESDARVRSFVEEANYYSARLATLQAARQGDQAIARRQSDDIDQTIARLKSNLEIVQSSLNSLVLRAPIAGRLTDFILQPGQSLKRGDQIGQIDSERAWRLDADIDEFYLGRVSVEQHATADLDSPESMGKASLLTVARVKPQVSGGQFRAELTFDSAPPTDLRRGESIECRITLGTTRRALVLPNGGWIDGSGGSFVFVLDASGHHAVRRAISTGRRNPDQVEVLGGVSDGERIITSSYSRFVNFSRLLIR